MKILRFSATIRHGLLMPSLILLVILFSLGCGKDKAPAPEIPPAEVETSSLTFNSPIGVEIVGKIINPGGGKITDHGFIYWFTAEDEISKGTKVSLGGEITSGFFTTTINGLKFPEVNGLQALFVAKAYVTDKNGTRYGEIFSSRYNGSIVSSIIPNEGKTGDIIALAGSYKGLKPSDIKITFGGIQTPIKTITDIGVTVEVPTGIPVGHGQTVEVKSSVGSFTSYVSHEFRIWANIKDMNPKFGPINTKIRFTGDNLPASKDAMHVYFELHSEVTGNSDYDNGFYVGVPGNIMTEKLTLSYKKGNVRAVLPWEFALTPPVIKSISPNPALDLQTVAIQLDNFLYLQRGYNEFSVKVGNFQQWVNANEDGKLIFRLDHNAKYATGNSYPVSITFGPHTISSSTALTIAKPEATGFSPKAGLPGVPIHITGKFAKGANYIVKFNSSGGVFFDAVSESEIVGRVLMGMEAKTYTLSVSTDAENVLVPGGVFEVLPTRFDAVSPSSATAGSTISITGEGFYNNGSTITANFAGHTAHVNSVTPNKITLVLGNSTPPGTYRIKLDWDNRIYDTGQSITVVR
ncbi:MAG: IPT/TIG domain-containing protein [Phormidesmis sp. FL-bin-119]|nr:IPT/TIG domain-containing protein [Pedobacter sp.]